MKITRRGFEFTLERNLTAIVSEPTTNYFCFCLRCGRNVRMISPRAAAAKLNTTVRTIYRLIEADQIHFAEMSDGAVSVCADSLSSVAASLELRN